MIIALLFCSALAQAADKVNLAPPMFTPAKEESTSAHQKYEFGETQMGGLPFIRVSSGSVAFYLPKLNSYSPEVFERAFCENPIVSKSPQTIDFSRRDKVITVADVKISKAISAYAKLVQETISSCDPKKQKTVEWNPDLQIGVKVDPGSKKNPNLRYKAFTQPLSQPNKVNTGVDF